MHLSNNKITGKAFLEVTDEVQEMVRPIGDRKALKSLVNSYKPQSAVSKAYIGVIGVIFLTLFLD